MTFAARSWRVQGWAGGGLGWASTLDVSYDNAGSIESSNTRDDILRLIKKFEVPTISIDLLHQMIVEFREKRENHAE